jgi:hypothetical protein
MEARLMISLESATAAKPAGLARRSGTDESELAAMLLTGAIDAADVSPETVTQLLDSEAALARAQLGLRQARAGQTIRADHL